MLDVRALELHDQITEDFDPLKLELEDDDFIGVINASITASETHYKEKKLYERQDKMVQYYLGDQLKIGGKDGLADYQPKYVENIVYEGVRRIKPIATSRLPDLTVKSGQDSKIARLMTDVLNTDIKKRQNRKLLGLAHVQEQLFLFAPIKARWNNEIDDYEFLNVYPKNIVWDHTCKTNNADDMRFIAESVELSVKEVMMMFPDAADKLLENLGVNAETNWSEDDKKSELKLASKIKIWEVWFHWWKETKDEQGVSKWEKINAVVWKYDNVILGKMRNPYFDYEGSVRLFDPRMREKQVLSEQDMYEAYIGQLGLEEEKIYHNYFKNPRKPYFFMVYESLGQDPIDATNRVEQVLRFQDHINDEGRQIIEMNERSAGKPVFNSDAIDQKTIKTLDWRNTRQALSVNAEDITKSFTHIDMPAAPQQLYKSKEENRQIAFEMLGVGETTRGVKSGDQTLGESQMFREQDFGFIDDLVEDTINEAAEWQAQWSMQFIRVFYTKQHYKDTVGKDGESLSVAIQQDMVDDGFVVEVSASGVDKLMRKRLAMETFKMGASDLLSFYEDIGADNPKERAYRAFLQVNAPQMFLQQYLMPEPKPGEASTQQQTSAPTQQPGMPGAAVGQLPGTVPPVIPPQM